MYSRFILTIFVAVSICSGAFASIDSLIIKGRILNLSGRLYRQAPSISFSRNNLLQSQSELSKQAPLEADGSFRVSLPMLFQREEIYVDYGGKAQTTFLGSPGTVEIVFDGDSLMKAKRLFYFSGVNAEANNQFPQYLASENRLFNSNTVLGAKFYETFWAKPAAEASVAAAKRAELRISALTAVSDSRMLDPALKQWVQSLSEDERLQNIFEYALANDVNLAANLLDSLNRLSRSPLTAQRVTWANRFGNYADRKLEERSATNPTRASSLPVRLMATLIKNNSSKLSEDDLDKLNDIISRGVAEKIQLDFLNNLYSKNEVVLNLLFNFERQSRTFSDLFDSTAVEFLRARYLSKNFYKYSTRQLLFLNKHIQTRIQTPQFRQSLDELVQLEVKDSADVRKMIAFKDVRTMPVEVLPGYWLTASNDSGTSWFNMVADKYLGKTLYIIKWNLEDEKSRQELDYLPILRAQLPPDVEFIFLHLPSEEGNGSKDLLKQYIVRHHLKGVHMFLNSNQMMDLLLKFNPLDASTFAIIKPNGKFLLKNAPAPSAMGKTLDTILQAGK